MGFVVFTNLGMLENALFYGEYQHISHNGTGKVFQINQAWKLGTMNPNFVSIIIQTPYLQQLLFRKSLDHWKEQFFVKSLTVIAVWNLSKVCSF